MLVKSLIAAVIFNVISTSFGEKIWMFAISGNRRPSDFIDTDGFVKGATLDLINSVCKIAGKRCEITVQPFEDCVRTVREKIFPGVGIMSQWYDACVGYVNTPERLNSMAFTNPYANTKATFTVALGNPHKFDPRNADALFSPRTNIPGLLVLPERFDCSGGVGMMVRKDSSLPEWWNPAFQKFYINGEYTQWCNTRGQKYGGYASASEYCLSPPTSVGTSSGLGR